MPRHFKDICFKFVLGGKELLLSSSTTNLSFNYLPATICFELPAMKTSKEENTTSGKLKEQLNLLEV